MTTDVIPRNASLHWTDHGSEIDLMTGMSVDIKVMSIDH